MMFLHIAEGSTTAPGSITSRPATIRDWFRDKVKDDELADEAADIEADGSLDPNESRARIADAVLRRYTVPAD